MFISATPLSALLAAEEALVVNRQIGTGIVFHKASEQYHGVRQMLASRQVRGICNGARYFDGETSAQQAFHRLIRLHKGAGWALVRVPPGMALKAKEAFIADGIEPSNVMIIGRNLSGMDDEPQYDIDDFKRRYDEARQFGDKLVAITVASCRAGINFGTQMKEELIGTWDSTISNIAAVVQANIGRACGYHDNNRAVHFTNLPAVKAYAGVLDVLEERCKNKPSSKVASLRMAYEAICREHDVRGLDVGAQVRNGDPLDTQPKVTEVYKIRDYVVVRARLEEESPKYGRTVRDPLLRNSIEAIRQILLGRDGVPSVCTHRRLRGASWLTVSWVNGDTYDNQEKAAAVGTYKARCRKLIDDDPSIRFNDLVPIGGGVQAEERPWRRWCLVSTTPRAGRWTTLHVPASAHLVGQAVRDREGRYPDRAGSPRRKGRGRDATPQDQQVAAVGPLSDRRGQPLRRVLRVRTLARGRLAYCAPMAGRP